MANSRTDKQINIDHSWQDLLYKLKRNFKRKPDLQTMLFLIGMQEYGDVREFTKEEKQDLMHIAVCKLLSYLNIYEYNYTDEDGWPHYDQKKEHPPLNLGEQEYMLKELILTYFEDLENIPNI